MLFVPCAKLYVNGAPFDGRWEASEGSCACLRVEYLICVGEGGDTCICACNLSDVRNSDCVAAKCRKVVNSELECILKEGILVKCYIHVLTCEGTEETARSVVRNYRPEFNARIFRIKEGRVFEPTCLMWKLTFVDHCLLWIFKIYFYLKCN